MKETEKRQTELTIEEARNLYGRVSKDDAMAYFIRANFTEEELNPKPKLPESWEELKSVSGYFTTTRDAVIYTQAQPTKNYSFSLYATEKQAKSSLAMAQLSQLMKVYNDGWEADWCELTSKYCIIRERNRIDQLICYNQYQFLSFKTLELRNEFLKNFEPLIKQYFMVD